MEVIEIPIASRGRFTYLYFSLREKALLTFESAVEGKAATSDQ